MRAPSPQCSLYPTAPYFLNSLSHYTSYSSSPSALTDSQKRQKLQQEFESGFADYEHSIDYTPPYDSLSQPLTRNINLSPHINLQRASEPASPTNLSAHSSPSPSRSRVAIMSTEQSSQDFQLCDDGMHISADRHQKQQVNRRYDSAHSFGHRASPTPNSRFGNGFPVAAPQSESHTSRPGLHYYPGLRPDNNDFSRPSTQQHQYLQTLPQFRNQGLNMGQIIQAQHHGSDDEDPPALSPHAQSQFSASSRPSLSDVDLHSPATPIASPGSSDGAEGCGAPVPAVREDTSYLVEAWMEHYLRSESDIHTPTPRLARTISDAIQDELFNPGIAPGTSVASRSRQDSNGVNSKLPTFLHQAQTQHSMVRATPPTTRDHSPFRDNSPFHPAVRVNQFPLPQSPSRTTSLLPVGFGTARAQREQEAEREAELLSRQIQHGFSGSNEAPKTISPKDAYVDYCEPEEEEVKGSLFPQDDAYSQDGSVHAGSYKGSIHGDDDAQSNHSFGIKTEESFGSMATSRRESDVSMNFNPQLYAGNGNQQYAQLGFPYTYPQMSRHSEEDGPDPISQASAVEEEHDYDYNPASSPNSKPTESKANRGVYTCTVPGCSQRFPTTTKMSKHRREAHRQSTPLSSIKSHHPGPHKCTRINPTTNKPCNTIFSRPYDLTRHEDTIHNTSRQKVRCEICNDEKTFSRQDALTRHKKVKHGIDK